MIHLQDPRRLVTASDGTYRIRRQPLAGLPPAYQDDGIMISSGYMTRSLRHSNTGCFLLFGFFLFVLMTGTAEVMTVAGI
jgi:hypothetical protein